MRRPLAAVLAGATGALACAGTAGAHVTVHPNALPAGSFTVVTVRVPNERDRASTTKVDVKFPAGVYFISTARTPGWTVRVTYRRLARPVTLFGSRITREVDRVIWSGGRIRPGEFVDFPLSIRVPTRRRGTLISFRALQTYSNREIVRWIGPPSAEAPAPQVAVMAAGAPVQDFAEARNAVRTAARRPSSAGVGPAPAAGAAGIGVALLLLGGFALARRRGRHP